MYFNTNTGVKATFLSKIAYEREVKRMQLAKKRRSNPQSAASADL